jgi:hypothetical protein
VPTKPAKREKKKPKRAKPKVNTRPVDPEPDEDVEGITRTGEPESED